MRSVIYYGVELFAVSQQEKNKAKAFLTVRQLATCVFSQLAITNFLLVAVGNAVTTRRLTTTPRSTRLPTRASSAANYWCFLLIVSAKSYSNCQL